MSQTKTWGDTTAKSKQDLLRSLIAFIFSTQSSFPSVSNTLEGFAKAAKQNPAKPVIPAPSSHTAFLCS